MTPTLDHLLDADVIQILNLFNIEPTNNQTPRQTLTEAVLDGIIPVEQLGSEE